MIIVKIQGGLGNQLFQWAFGFAHAKKFKTEVDYDISFFQLQNNHRVSFKLFDLPNLIKCDIPLYDQNTEVTLNKSQVVVVTEKFGNFFDFESTYNSDYHYFCDGYWQDPDYFKAYRSEILSYIDFKVDHAFDFANSCSLHVRRGDYVGLQEAHPLQDLNYYKNAIEEINPQGNIFVFSDDIEWCKSNLKFDKLIFMENNSNIQDLKLMSLCNHNIIANSTFSWWGAWLNQHEDKKICAPKKWFGPKGPPRGIGGLIPNEWIRL